MNGAIYNSTMGLWAVNPAGGFTCIRTPSIGQPSLAEMLATEQPVFESADKDVGGAALEGPDVFINSPSTSPADLADFGRMARLLAPSVPLELAVGRTSKNSAPSTVFLYPDGSYIVNTPPASGRKTEGFLLSGNLYTNFLGTRFGKWYLSALEAVTAGDGPKIIRLAKLYKRRGDYLAGLARELKGRSPSEEARLTRSAVMAYDSAILLVQAKNPNVVRFSEVETRLLADLYLAKARMFVGWGESTEGDIQLAVKVLDNAAALYKSLGDVHARANAKELMGDALMRIRRYHEATHEYVAAGIEAPHDPKTLARLMGKQAKALSEAGLHVEAGGVYMMRAERQIEAGDFDAADASIANMLSELTHVRNYRKAADAMHVFAKMYYDMSGVEDVDEQKKFLMKTKAADLFTRATALYMQAFAAGDTESFSMARSAIVKTAVVKANIGKMTDAIIALETFVKGLDDERLPAIRVVSAEMWVKLALVCDRAGNYETAGQAAMRAGEIYEQAGLYDRSISAFVEAERYFLKRHSRWETARAVRARAAVMRARGDNAEEILKLEEEAKKLMDESSEESRTFAAERVGRVAREEVAVHALVQHARSAISGPHGSVRDFDKFLETAAGIFNVSQQAILHALAEGGALWDSRIAPTLEFRPGLDVEALRAAARVRWAASRR